MVVETRLDHDRRLLLLHPIFFWVFQNSIKFIFFPILKLGYWPDLTGSTDGPASNHFRTLVGLIAQCVSISFE